MYPYPFPQVPREEDPFPNYVLICLNCKGPMRSSPSDDFCDETCQARWITIHRDVSTAQPTRSVSMVTALLRLPARTDENTPAWLRAVDTWARRAA